AGLHKKKPLRKPQLRRAQNAQGGVIRALALKQRDPPPDRGLIEDMAAPAATCDSQRWSTRACKMRATCHVTCWKAPSARIGTVELASCSKAKSTSPE